MSFIASTGSLLVHYQASIAAKFSGLVYAAKKPKKDTNPFDGWVGSPDTSWLNGYKTNIQHITGMGLGAALVVGVLMIALGFGIIALAGKSEARQQAGVATVKNAMIGIGGLIIGIPLVIAFLGAMV